MKLPKDVESFKRAMEDQEIGLKCTFCDAHLWMEHIDGHLHLMRISEMEVEQCPICTEIHEMIE